PKPRIGASVDPEFLRIQNHAVADMGAESGPFVSDIDPVDDIVHHLRLAAFHLRNSDRVISFPARQARQISVLRGGEDVTLRNPPDAPITLHKAAADGQGDSEQDQHGQPFQCGDYLTVLGTVRQADTGSLRKHYGGIGFPATARRPGVVYFDNSRNGD
ncbi:MAG: hypothetical protein WAU86_24175, partial [Oricola sp.]